MDGQSLNIKQDILNKLKQLIPHCFTEDKVDWKKLKVFLEDNIEFRNERYHLNWAGKTDAFRLLQAPTYKTLKPCREESVNFDETENLFIEGDNLEVLKTLQKSYFGKIKMIYIDPPYNTGNDFIYKDDYSETLAEYKQKVGDVDENGNATKAQLFKNTKENGQYHSNWLNMMYPRLFLARNLLRDDGVIFVSIDDNEVHNLRLMMDEIFGEENFVSSLIWKSKSGGANDSKFFATDHEYICCYAKNSNELNLKMDTDAEVSTRYNLEDEKGKYALDRLDKQSIRYSPSLDYVIKDLDGNEYRPKHKDPNNPNATWRWSKETVEKRYNELVFKNGFVYTKNYQKDGAIPRSLLIDERFGRTRTGKTELFGLFNRYLFENPKPQKLIKHLLNITTNKTDLILDFFAGSGTTAHAVMELNKEDGGNRKFILVQLPEPTDPNSEAYKAGYKTIADIAKERIRRAAKKIQDELNEEKKKKGEKIQFEPQEEKKLDLGFKVFKLDESNFKQWRPFVPKSPEDIQLALQEHVENLKTDATTENILYELMLKNGKKLTDKVEKKNGYYVVNASELVLLLESIEKSVIDETLHLKPQKVIALDKLFNGNDQLKTNTVLQFSDLGIEFKSV